MKDPLKVAEKTYVDVNIFDDEHKDKLSKLEQLPGSCEESADQLVRQRDIYTMYNVFPNEEINFLVNLLKSHKDKGLISKIKADDEKIMNLVNKYFYCG